MAERSLRDPEYLFLRMYSIDLQTARHALGLMDHVEDADVRMCMIRDIVVTYGRPFAGNRPGKNRLDEMLPGVIRPEMLALHMSLRSLRNSLFAHTDLDAHDPRPAMWGEPGAATFPMAIRGTYYEQLNALVPGIRELVVQVEAAINAEVLRREEAFARDAV